MNIGQKQQLKEIIDLNLEKKLGQIKLRKLGMENRKKNNLKQGMLV